MSDHKDTDASEEQQSNSTIDFEASIQQLEALVKDMESGDLTLEQSLAAFEKGVALARRCQEALKQAEERIAQLSVDESTGS